MRGAAIRIGTRGSRLALAQSRQVREALCRRHPSKRFRLVTIRTFGDEFQSVEIFKKNGVGVFTKEIEKKLLDGAIDIAVHSLKDLPTDLPNGLTLASVPKRLDPADALVTRDGATLESLPSGSRVGTGSPRRKRQIARLRPDLRVMDLRGNLDTRLRKVLKERKLDAVVVASAGLKRLGRQLRSARRISTGTILPAVGQAALALETRKDDTTAIRVARSLNHSRSEKEVLAERALLRRLQGGCRVPLGVQTTIKGPSLAMKAIVFSTRNHSAVEASIRGSSSSPEAVGRRLGEKLLRSGADKLMREARS